ncbi:DUF3379 family protein [Veronia pacifica]|uniref:DUF3379 domain-containing protein n=1 Tax=Veronia pacifica TaxID=1080227 RepID=A0A1C3EEH4_9GAMM|nr:DUF3379 family protein [Veronia pacifica]ODA31638.1 hypothetical protein A8L45_16085 [Veronia pacifica]
MDELEFRRRILADPQDNSPEVLEMRKASASNEKFQKELEQFDEILDEALRVDVPEDLADKIMFKHKSEIEKKQLKPSFNMSIAASVAFVFGVAIGQFNWSDTFSEPSQDVAQTSKKSLGQMAISQYYKEVGFSKDKNEKATLEQINAKLSPFGEYFDAFPGKITFVNHCNFGGQGPALHLDIITDEGQKMTIFMVPPRGNVLEGFADDKMKAVIKDSAKNRVIIVGDKGSDIEPVANELVKHIRSI